MTAQTVRLTQAFTYATDGKLIKSVAADGTITLWCHYKNEGGESPDLKDFLDSKWKSDIWQSESRSLKAPKTVEGLPLRVMAEFQYMLQEKVVMPTSLKLYGYSATHPNEVDTVISVEGVTLSNITAIEEDPLTAWNLQIIAGRNKALIHCQTTLKEENTLTVTERRYWNKERQQLKTRQVRSSDMKAKLTKLTLSSMVNDVTPETWQELCTEERSIYRGLLMRRTESKQQQRFSYDALDRITEEITYANDPKQNPLATRTDKKLAHTQTRYEYAKNGCIWAVKTDVVQSDTPVRRILHDGLQQVVGKEQQRTTTRPVRDTDFCPIYGQDGAYDYLPGGLQRYNKDLRGLSGDVIWGASSEKEQEVKGQLTPTQIIEETLGNQSGPLLIRVRSQQNQNKGGFILREEQKLPEGAPAADKKAAGTTEKTFDEFGCLKELKQTFATDPKTERLFKIEYDELHRPIEWIGPDKTSVKRVYAGMSDTVNQISVKGGGAADTEVVLGTQILENNAFVKERSVGKLKYRFEYRTDRRPTSQTLPDETQIFSEVSPDGNTLTWKAKAAGKTEGVVLATFTYNLLTRALNSNDKADKSLTITAPKAPWRDVLYTRVTSGLTFNARRYSSLAGAEYIEGLANGLQARVWRDHLNRRTRSMRGDLDYHYFYNAWGECSRTTVRDMTSGHVLKVNHEFDSFGRETARRYVMDDDEVEVYLQEWSASGQLLRKTVTRKGVTCLDEIFKYDNQERIQEWSVSTDSTAGPRNSSGKIISSQKYTHDVLNNLTSCETEFVDGSKQNQTYTYNADIPTQRSKIKTVTTPAPDSNGKTPNASTEEKTLTYDANGNLIQDELDRKMTYTLLGQLESVSDKNKNLITKYEYDEQDRLANQWDEGKKQRLVFIYSENILCAQVWVDEQGKELQRLRLDTEAGLVTELIVNESKTTSFIISDPQNGVSSEYQLASSKPTTVTSIAYTPWGECDDGLHRKLISGLGFNGERRDPLTGAYHLGNGYRVYSPAQRAFQQPDRDSPFGRGGINNYAYCGGDPVNLYDPSGHVMISRWGQDQMINKLDQLINEYTPKPPEPQEAAQGSGLSGLLTTIIWAAVAVLLAVSSVLLALPTGGLSLVAASALLTVTVVSSAISITSASLQNSNPELAAKLGWASFGIDMATILIPFKAALSYGMTFVRWAGSKAGRMAIRIGNSLSRTNKLVPIIHSPSRAATVARGNPTDDLGSLDIPGLQGRNTIQTKRISPIDDLGSLDIPALRGQHSAPIKRGSAIDDLGSLDMPGLLDRNFISTKGYTLKKTNSPTQRIGSMEESTTVFTVNSKPNDLTPPFLPDPSLGTIHNQRESWLASQLAKELKVTSAKSSTYNIDTIYIIQPTKSSRTSSARKFWAGKGAPADDDVLIEFVGYAVNTKTIKESMFTALEARSL